MKKLFFIIAALSLLVSACGTFAQPSAPADAAAPLPSPIASADLAATAADLAQQTLAAMPTPTLQPSNTPEIFTETPTSSPTETVTATLETTPTETQNPFLLTLTATLGTGTPMTVIPFDTPAVTADTSAAPTGTEYPRTYGTLPPSLPAATLYLINKSNKEATISLHCTTKNGTTTILEYPVNGAIKVKAPAGSYYFISWVNGRKFTGNFKLPVGADVSVILYKDRVEVK